MKMLIGILFLLTSNAAHAQGFITGNKLHQLLMGDSLSQLQAVNYIAGAVDTLLIIYCPSPNVSLGMIVDETKKTLESYNQEEKNRPASEFVNIVLKNRYSCPQKDPNPPKKPFEDRLQTPRPKILI